MKLLLIRPNNKGLLSRLNIINVEPLELEYLKAVCSDLNLQCEIYDAMVEKRKFSEVLMSYRPDVVSITGYCCHKDIMLKYAEISKSYNPDIKVIVGGVHAEINYKEFFQHSIDVIVHSGGLHTFKNIVKSGFQLKELKELNGICFKEQHGSWIINDKAYFEINNIPFPDRSHFYKNLKKFKYLNYGPVAMIKTSYGCPFNCSFCYCKLLNNGQYFTRDVESVASELKEIECETIWIIDDTFLVSKERLKEFHNRLKELEIKKKFIMYSRADFIANNEDILPLLKDMGTIDVIVGLEAVENETLNDFNKKVTCDENEKCVRMLKKYGINCTGLFIVNVDAVSEDFRRLWKWIRRMELTSCTLSIYTPLPGTEDFNQNINKIKLKNYRKLDFLHLIMDPVNISRFIFYYEVYKFYIKVALKNIFKRSSKHV